MRSLLLVLLLPSMALANSIILDSTGKSLEVITSAAVSTDYAVSYADNTASAFTPGNSAGNISTATTTTILAAPAASTQRQVKWLTVRNRDASVAQTVTLVLDVSATERQLTPAIALEAGESLVLTAEGRVIVYTASGIVKGEATYVCTGAGACVNNGVFTTTYVQNDGGYDVAAKSVEVTMTLSGGAGYYQTTVTGQTWVTATSRIACTPFGTTADGLTPEAVAAAGLIPIVATLVAGVGFDVFLSSPAGLDGTVRLHCLGAP